ncbi:MAG: hypothetical protein R2805_00765 [Flavobacterium sp.]|uniref:hypothetical protein n=1 Tax=Flavobacterium sp. TaxID=239 RepID=UPI0035279E09
MATVLKKTIIYQFLFTLCVLVPYFDNFELTFAIWTLVAILTIQNNYSLTFIKQVACYVSILGIALIIQFFREYSLYFIIRDITYLIKPVLGLLLGYQLLKRIGENPFKLIVNTGLIIALLHLIILLFSIVFYRASNVSEIRYYAGYFNDFEVYSLVIVIFYDKFPLSFSRKKALFYIAIIGFSSFMYLARTNFIQFFILIFALKGFFKINIKAIIILFTLIITAIIGYATILYINPKRNGEGLEAFLYKIKIAPIEPFKTKIDRNNWKDLNDNYRSYENIMTIKEVSNEGVTTVMFGKGLGSKIDLKVKMMLNGVDLRYISILHNGYMTVFLKSGILGIIILLISFRIYFKKFDSQIPIVQQINLLLVGTGLFLIISYWVFMGFYFKADTKSILVGFLLCLREFYISKDKKINS